MIAPRFTLRTGLIWLTGGALVAVVLREAVAGEKWAIGFTAGLAAIVLALLLQAAMYGVAVVFSGDKPGGDS